MRSAEPSTWREEAAPWLLVLAPPLLATGALYLWAASDTAGGLGPLDRATSGWLVVVPMLFAAVGLSAVLPRYLGQLLGYMSLVMEGLAAGSVVILLLVGHIRVIGCTPVTDPSQVFLPALGVGASTGAALVISGYFGSVFAHQPRWGLVIAPAVAIVIAVMLFGFVFLVWTILFPVFLCAPGPG